MSPRPASSAFQRRLDQFFYGSECSDEVDALSDNANGEPEPRSESANGWHTTRNKELQVRVPGSLPPQKLITSSPRELREARAVSVLNSESETVCNTHAIESESKHAAIAGLELARKVNEQLDSLEARLVKQS